jgi:multidrug efflux system membrane fusion protein
MTADYNGWQDAPEEEREAYDDTDADVPMWTTAPRPRSFASLRMTMLALANVSARSAFSALSALALALALYACSGSKTQPVAQNSVRPIAVRAAPVIDTLLSRPIVATGTVAHKDEIGLSFKVGGVIARVAVDPGDEVRAGQTLATLQLREIDAGLSKARSAAVKAERDLARARRLYADRAVSLEDFQNAETAAEVARADLDAAAFNRRYAVIVAPSAGTVLRRSAEPGETVDPGTTVLVLGSQARGNIVAVGLADRDVVSVRKGDGATVGFDALPGQSFQGRVTQIDAAADPGTGAYGVEITIPDGSGLVAGLVGRVEIRPAISAPAMLVPVEAVLEADGNEATVYALSADGSRAERRRVKVAFIAGSNVAVAGGLEGATAVLTDGAAYLDDGVAVKVAQ